MVGGVVWTGLLVLLSCWGGGCGRARRGGGAWRRGMCTEAGSTCVDLDKLHSLVENVGHNIKTSDNERILLECSNFNKIRTSQNHGCVLIHILVFYEQVLQKRGGHKDLLFLINRMRTECVRKKKKMCVTLEQRANQTQVTTVTTVTPVTPVWTHVAEGSARAMNPLDAAVLQLQTLQAATDRLEETETLDKAMVELENLQYYVNGRGLRQSSRH